MRKEKTCSRIISRPPRSEIVTKTALPTSSVAAVEPLLIVPLASTIAPFTWHIHSLYCLHTWLPMLLIIQGS